MWHLWPLIFLSWKINVLDWIAEISSKPESLELFLMDDNQDALTPGASDLVPGRSE